MSTALVKKKHTPSSSQWTAAAFSSSSSPPSPLGWSSSCISTPHYSNGAAFFRPNYSSIQQSGTALMTKPNAWKDHKKYCEPTRNDYLLGRGVRSQNHPGNQRYHQARIELQQQYKAAPDGQKGVIVQKLVDLVHSWGGRFLGWDEDCGEWFVVTNKKALFKTRRLLRYTVRKHGNDKPFIAAEAKTPTFMHHSKACRPFPQQPSCRGHLGAARGGDRQDRRRR